MLDLVGVNPAEGLPSSEIDSRREKYGPNTFPEMPARSFFAFVWDACQDATLFVLFIAAGLSLIAGLIQDVHEGWHDGVAILFAISLCVFVSAWNDYSQMLQFRGLNADKRNIQINVLRDGRRAQVSVFDLVVGDIVVVAIGDQIPADGLLLNGQSVVVDESAMTGESDPLKKSPDAKPFMLSGCKVNEGYGEMVVTATGLNTEWGRIMAVTSEDNDEETPLQMRLDAVATGIGKVGTVIAVIVFLVLFLRNVTSGSGKWYTHLIDAFIVGVTIIVVAVPEGLPLAVTLSLAYSMKKMMLDKALVRHLSACEGMGGATAICSDKTGTLTTNKMTVVRCWVAGQTSPADRPAGPEDVPAAAVEVFTQSCFLNTTGAVSPAPDGVGIEVAGSPTEQALLRFSAQLPGASFPELRARLPLLHMQPFNSAKKNMGVAVRVAATGATRVYWKGASEIVLQACTKQLGAAGTAVALTPQARTELEQLIDTYAHQSLRTLLLAYVDVPASKTFNWEEEELPWGELTAIALVGIKDPCRPGVPEAVAACQAAGIVVRMVTGDNVVTARAIAEECGIFDEKQGHVALEGPVFRDMPKAEVLKILPHLRVLARSSPTDKHTLVSLLRSLGEVVAVTGDGTNDAPALHEADIGLAMGIAGTEVAKEASDIIILDDNFASCVRVVRWGRSVYRNIQAFVQFQLTVNVVALVLNMICALTVGDIPLTAVQLLWVNMIMDTMGALALATEPPRDSLMLRKPYGRTEPIISNIMWRNLLAMAVFQLIVLFTLFFRGCDILGFGTSPTVHWIKSPVNGTMYTTVPFAWPPVPHVHYFPGVHFLTFPVNVSETNQTTNVTTWRWVNESMRNPCEGRKTVPYMGSTSMDSVSCFDDRHGCPPLKEIDGSKLSMHDRLEYHDYITLTTTIFNTFVFMQVFNEINARNMEDLNVFRGLFTNRIFMSVLAFTGLAQWIIVTFAGDFAQTTPLRWQHWILSVIIGLCTMPWAFVVKFINVPVSPPLPEVVLPKWFFKKKRVDEESGEAGPPVADAKEADGVATAPAAV